MLVEGFAEAYGKGGDKAITRYLFESGMNTKEKVDVITKEKEGVLCVVPRETLARHVNTLKAAGLYPVVVTAPFATMK